MSWFCDDYFYFDKFIGNKDLGFVLPGVFQIH